MKKFSSKDKAGFTYVPNGILSGRNLSAKALGVYFLIVSRPDGWHFSVKGLCSLCSDGYASINSAVTELEKAGFIKREGIQHRNGRYAGGDWIIYDTLRKEITGCENQDSENRNTIISGAEKQSDEKMFVENSFIENSGLLNTEQINTEQTNTEQISLQSKKEMMTEEFKNRIDYEVLSDTYGSELLDCICKTVTETLCGGKKTVRINGSDIPLADVSERYSQLNSENLSFVIDTVAENKNGIKNPVSYWASVLYNAPVDEKLWVESEFNKYRKETGI